MKKRVDARGLTCPLPVINTKRVLDQLESGTVITTVDNPVARDNLLKLALSSGCMAQAEERAGEFTVTIVKQSGEQSLGQAVQVPDVSPLSGGQVVVLTSSTIGRGDEELGRVLMRSFLFTLSEAEQCPDSLIFLNSGVKLTTEESQVFESLHSLSERGCELLSCGTCLDFLGLKDKLAMGRISNMYEIVEKMQQAKSLITL